MTVLHIIEPFAGGVTTFINHITRQLSGYRHVVLHGRRNSVDTIENVRRSFPGGVEFVEWNYVQREIRPLADLRALLFLIRFLKKNDFDVIHLHSSKAGVLGRLACLLRGIRSVLYTPHAAPFQRTDISWATKQLYKVLEKLSSLLPAPIVACCNDERMEYQKIGIHALCINNGTECTIIDKGTNVEGKTVVICSALLNRQKNPARFSEIASHFNGRRDVEFYWVGDGEMRHEITADNVTVTGWLKSGEVKEFYRKASIYLATSDWEGLPYSVLEAMNAQCCLLLSDCGGHRDVVVPGKNGFLFRDSTEAAQRLNELLADPARIAQMGSASADLCREAFDAVQMGEAYNLLYLRLSNDTNLETLSH